MNTNLPQLAAASDLAAAAHLRRRSDLAAAAARLNLTADLMSYDAPAQVAPAAEDVWADEAAGRCTCPEGMCVEADCAVCHVLAADLPCPADVIEPAPAGITVDVGEVVDLGPDVFGAGELVPIRSHPSPTADVVEVHQFVDQALTAAGYSVEVEPAGPPASPGTGHLPTLDWSSRHDPRSLAFGVRDHLAAAPLQLADVTLPVGPVLNQGAEGACVGMAVVTAANVLDELAGNLDGLLLAEVDADRVYRRAQQLDARAGEGYSGTSVLGGMRAAVEAGVFGRYLWAFGTRDIASTILSRRPVIVGIPWLSGMYETGPGGLVTLAGDDVGLGHCLTLVGLRLKGPNGEAGPFFVWQNTWGTGYGDGGLGYVHHRDLAQLLRSHGEAAVPMPVTVT